MLIISTPIITKADLIEGSIINCVQCDIQIYMHMNEIKVRVTRSRKVESLRLDLLFHGTNYHRLHLFARPCYTLNAFIDMRPFFLHLLFVEIGMKVQRCYQKLQRLDLNLRKRLGP